MRSLSEVLTPTRAPRRHGIPWRDASSAGTSRPNSSRAPRPRGRWGTPLSPARGTFPGGACVIPRLQAERIRWLSDASSSLHLAPRLATLATRGNGRHMVPGMRPPKLLIAVALVVGSVALADDSSLISDARATIDTFKKTDPKIDKFFSSAAGYAVFPTIGKGAVVVGGAGGDGVLFVGGQPIGKASMGQATIGFQLGGQTYSEVVFFETASSLNDFKKGDFALAAQASAVALSAGAAATAKYEKGVAIFTATKGGLMYEASVGGQKFGYKPFAAAKK